MIGHRGEAFKNLYRDIHPQLAETVRNKAARFSFHLIGLGRDGSVDPQPGRRERVLCCMCGAFSDKWLDVARRCGKEAEALQVEWGKHIDQKAVDRAAGERADSTPSL